MRVPRRRQVRAFALECLFPFPAAVVGQLEAGPFGLNQGPGRAGCLPGRLVEPVQLQTVPRAVPVTGQRLGVEEQRTDGRVRGPIQLAEQLAGAWVLRPHKPRLGESNGLGVPVGRLAGRGLVVIVGGRPQLVRFRLHPQNLLLGLGQPPGFSQAAFGQREPFACARGRSRGQPPRSVNIARDDLGPGRRRAGDLLLVAVAAGTQQYLRGCGSLLDRAQLGGQATGGQSRRLQAFPRGRQDRGHVLSRLPQLTQGPPGVVDRAGVVRPLPLRPGQRLVRRRRQRRLGPVALDEVIGGLEDLAGLDRLQRVVDLRKLLGQLLSLPLEPPGLRLQAGQLAKPAVPRSLRPPPRPRRRATVSRATERSVSAAYRW